MEIRAFADRILFSPELEAKLQAAPAELSDEDPGPAIFVEAPARSPELQIRSARAARVPPIAGIHDRAQRARVVHALANHEFQAVELFAWALRAFPQAPAEFRRGLLRVLADEQRHTRMYLACLEQLGARFGEFPVSGYFWRKLTPLRSPREFVCAMSLTFENANLDHTLENAAAALAVGDERLARVVERVHRDEIEHVAFGREWLERFKEPEETLWEAYCRSVRWPLRPALARGAGFDAEGRAAAGLDADFIRKLEAAESARPRRRLRGLGKSAASGR